MSDNIKNVINAYIAEAIPDHAEKFNDERELIISVQALKNILTDYTLYLKEVEHVKTYMVQIH